MRLIIQPRDGIKPLLEDVDRASFMLAEIDGDKFYFQAISRTGQVVDSGVLDLPQRKIGFGVMAAGAVAI